MRVFRAVAGVPAMMKGQTMYRVELGDKVVSDAMLQALYLQIINAGKKLVAANCSGFLFSKLLSLLHSIHLGPRTQLRRSLEH